MSKQDVPELWIRKKSKARGQYYYYNTRTKDSVWEKPVGVDILDHSSLKNEHISPGTSKVGEQNEHNSPGTSKVGERNEHNSPGTSKVNEQPEGKKVNILPKTVKFKESSIEKHQPEKQMDPKMKNDNKDEEDFDRMLLKRLREEDEETQYQPPAKLMKTTSYTATQDNETSEVEKPCTSQSPQEQRIIGKTRTPMQDRYNKRKLDLLDTQLKKNEETQYEPLAKVMKTTCYTATQDNDKTEVDLETARIEPRKPSIRDRLGWKKPFNQRGVKERYSLESGTMARKPITLGEYKQRYSLESGPTVRTRNTFDKVERYNSLVSPGSSNKEVPFDAREKLNKKKEKTDSIRLSDASDSMDWEPCSTEESTHAMVDRLNGSSNATKIKSPPQLGMSKLTNVYLVCDTCAILGDCLMVDKLLRDGAYLGLPVTVVIPYVVHQELEGLSCKQEETGFKAREIQRILSSNSGSKHLRLQDCNVMRDVVGAFEIKTNDDLVINCCLQWRDKCSENEIAVIMTKDINLGNKSTSLKIKHFNLHGFKSWARGFRQDKFSCNLNQGSPVQQKAIEGGLRREEEEMDVDRNTHDEGNKPKPLNVLYNNHTNDLDATYKELPTDNPSKKNILLQNCINSNVNELKSDFQGFLHDVLVEAHEREYGEKNWQKFTNNIMPSWTLLTYIYEVMDRWFLITSRHLSDNVKSIFKDIIALVKKHNKEKEDFTINDVNNVFIMLTDVGKIISKHSRHGKEFLNRLKVLRDEWIESHKSFSTENTLQNMSEEDVQPVDVALQNIYNYYKLHFDNLKSQFESSNTFGADIKDLLSKLFKKVQTLELTIENVRKQNSEHLTTKNKKIISLHGLLSNFSVRESPSGFEVTLENVIELFLDESYRNSVSKIVRNLEKLKFRIDDLMIHIQ